MTQVLLTNSSLCTVDVSTDQEMISSGFEDSSIKLWKISPGLLQRRETDMDPSKIHLAADFWHVHSEERLDYVNFKFLLIQTKADHLFIKRLYSIFTLLCEITHFVVFQASFTAEQG